MKIKFIFKTPDVIHAGIALEESRGDDLSPRMKKLIEAQMAHYLLHKEILQVELDTDTGKLTIVEPK